VTEPRKQPKQARARATVEAVVEAAARILERDGASALNTNHIADVAGVSIGTLYQYFPTKEAVIAALIRRERAGFKAALEAIELVAADLPWVVVRTRLVAAAVDHQLARPHLAHALEYLERGLPEGETESFNEGNDVVLGRILARAGLRLPSWAARDLAAMVRWMADAAGLAGEQDAAALSVRISAAVDGYIAAFEGVTPP
jgi:AcrR family transcriptional regulator